MAYSDYAVAILTAGRVDATIQCIQSVVRHKPKRMEAAIVANGMSDEDRDALFDYVQTHHGWDAEEHEAVTWLSTDMLGVAKPNIAMGKNRALNYFFGAPLDPKRGLFIIENDIEVVSSKAFTGYIRAHEKYGLGHMNWAFHERPDHEPVGRIDKTSLDVFRNIGGGFQFFSRDVIVKAGLFDERFPNCWEHCEHTHRISLLPSEPDYWTFPDVRGSKDWLRDIDVPTENETHADRARLEAGFKYWHDKCVAAGVPFPFELSHKAA